MPRNETSRRLVTGSKGAWPYHEGRHLIVALRQFVFADESGTHDGSRYCIVAGYRGSPGQWERFKPAWNKILASEHAPPFHTNVFLSRRVRGHIPNPYAKWSERRAKDYFGRLLKQISDRKVYSVGCAVDIPAFNALSYGERCALTDNLDGKNPQPRKLAPYYLAFRTMLGAAIEGTHPDTELHFRFALQDEYNDHAKKMFREIREHGKVGTEHQLASVDFWDAAKWPGLQAADIYASHWYNASVTPRSRLNKTNTASMNMLTRDGRGVSIYDADGLERVLGSVVSPQERQFLRNMKQPNGRRR